MNHSRYIFLMAVLMLAPSSSFAAEHPAETAESAPAASLSVDKKNFPPAQDHLKSDVIQLKYAAATDLLNTLTQMKTPEGKVIVDEKSNTIILMDAPQPLTAMQKFIRDVDVPRKELLIEGKILQIVLNDEHKTGVDWEAIVSDYHSLKFNEKSAGDDENDGRLSIGTISPEDYAILLDALDTVGKINVVSNPRVTALDNREAKILAGSTEPYLTTTKTRHSSGPTTTAETINFMDVGMKLHVVPVIHKDRYITMKIKPDPSPVDRSVAAGKKNPPSVSAGATETSIMVKDGMTIVIGGLVKDEKIESVKKIPLLGDLPLVGAVFRNEGQLIRKTETVIFLTPHITTGDRPGQYPLNNDEE